MLTLKAALEEASAAIDRVDAQVLVAHLLGVDRAYLIANPMRVLTESEDARFDLLVALRALGQPVAYLVAEREFYGRPLTVGPGVLIPRPETEILVEHALARLGEEGDVADLGTGSGAIAVTLACERPKLRVTATDTSAEALARAEENAKRLGVEKRIAFAQGSWYAPLAGARFDVIVSNPPYVATGDPHLGQGDLRFEPESALTDGSADGLASIAAIVAGAAQHLKPGGWLVFEHGYDQREAAAALLARAGFTDLLLADDLAGIPRVAGGRLMFY